MRRLTYLFLLVTIAGIYSCHSDASSFTITDVRSGAFGNTDSIANRLLGQHVYIAFYDNAAKMNFNNQMTGIALLKNADGVYIGSSTSEPKVEYQLTLTQGTFSISQIQIAFTTHQLVYGTNTMGIPVDQHTYVTAKKD